MGGREGQECGDDDHGRAARPDGSTSLSYAWALLRLAQDRADEAAALFRLPASGDPGLVARHAARYGIDLTS